MNYFRNNGVILIIIWLLVLQTSCRQKKPQVNEDEYRVTEKSMAEVHRIMISKDKERIKSLIEREQLDMTESPTGLWYSVQNPESGKQVEIGMNVSLKYTLSLFEGKECYTSDEVGIKTFRVGRGGVESGLEEGILLMKLGGRAKFIMPPHLAHGLPGDGDCIPPRSIIIYDIEVLSLE